MHRLRILISFWASTLVDEFCQIASKDKAISKAKLIPLVFFGVTALRPLRPPRLCVPSASRASRYTDCRSRSGLRRDTEDKEARRRRGFMWYCNNCWRNFRFSPTVVAETTETFSGTTCNSALFILIDPIGNGLCSNFWRLFSRDKSKVILV